MTNQLSLNSAASEPVAVEPPSVATPPPVPLSDKELDGLLDEALRETFPASDAIAVSRIA